jgi:hypothetical protein
MKKIILLSLVLPFISVIFIACSGNDDPIDQSTGNAELFIRDDASTTTIPLVMNTTWRYKKVYGEEEKPDKQIKNLLIDDEIIDMKILPVRHFDNNEGWGKYEYQSLCYITTNNQVFFYMNDRIYIGRYLYPDNYGFESVIWDYELPTHFTENSTGYYTLNRNATINDPNININENFLQEMPGLSTIVVEIDGFNLKQYKDCKLFQFHNIKGSNETDRINMFYFKAGKGLISYQQYLKADSTMHRLYELNLLEE